MTGQPFVSFPDVGKPDESKKEGCLRGGEMSDQKNLG